MRARTLAVAAAGVAGFAVAVGLGAVAIVSLAPGEPLGKGSEASLLVENPTVAPTMPVALPLPPSAPRTPLPRLSPTAPPPAPLAETPSDPSQAEAPIVLTPPVLRRAGRRSEPPAKAEPGAPPDPAAPTDPTPGKGQVASLPSPRDASPPVVLPTVRRPPEPQQEGVMTLTEINRLHRSMRLTPEQEAFWPPVELVLRDIGIQQQAAIKAGQNPNDSLGGGLSMRVFFAAKPLLNVLREDQKAPLRQRARAMGYGSIAGAF